MMVEPESSPLDAPSENSHQTHNERTDTIQLGILYWALCLLALFFGFFLAVGFQTACSSPLKGDHSEWNESLFQETKSRKHLREISSLGPKLVGSPENEAYAPDYIKKTLSSFTQKQSGELLTELNEQIADLGSFTLGGMTSVYQNIRNIAFRICNSSHVGNRSAVLINCHYDSVIASPGASDDVVSCATMLEVIRVILARQSPLKHDLIFLFNGAEENMLQASHAFVTQHAWMQDVRVFINLEAAGSGGRQMVFQAGPENPWIIDEYAQIATQPFASVFCQDVFKLGLIPSDTDFRIFRDYGGVPGIDIAYISNGYVYHTEFDVEERIPPSCIQNSGENLLKLVLKIANSPYVTDPGSYKAGDAIFYDFLGIFFVYYHSTTGFVLNMVTCLVVICCTVAKIYYDKTQFKYIFWALLNHIACLLASTFLLLMIGFLMHQVGSRMSWYALRYNIMGVYVFPLVWYFFFHHSYVVKRSNFWPTAATAEESHFEAAQLLITAGLLILTWLKVDSAYMLMIWVLIPFVCRKIVSIAGISVGNGVQLLDVVTKVLTVGIPYIYWMYMIFSLFDVLIPIMGRSGGLGIPDCTMAVMVIVGAVPILLYFTGDLYLTKKSVRSSLRFLFFHSTISYLILVNFSSFGFPYNSSTDMPRRQRLATIHVNRVFRNSLGATESYDSGIWLVPLDCNPSAHLLNYLPELRTAKPVTCGAQPYCGFPHLYPLAHVFTTSYYLPRKQHRLLPSVELVIKDRIGLSPTLFNVTFTVQGPSHTHIFLMTAQGVKLWDWSFSEPPIPKELPAGGADSDTEHYFVYYSYGKRPDNPLTVWALFEVESVEAVPNATVEVALSGHYTHSPGYRTMELQGFLRRLPDWTTAMPWAATYERWVIRLHDSTRFLQ